MACTKADICNLVPIEAAPVEGMEVRETWRWWEQGRRGLEEGYGEVQGQEGKGRIVNHGRNDAKLMLFVHKGRQYEPVQHKTGVSKVKKNSGTVNY